MHEPDTSHLARPICWFCGEPEVLEIADIYTDHTYVLDTCCPALLERIGADMADDPESAPDLLRRLGAELLTGQRLRRVCDDTGTITLLDYKLEVRPISFRDAARFVAKHHTHCGPPLMHRFSLGVWNGRWSLLGVVMVGNPVARALMGRNLVEALRVCVRRDTEPMLRDGCCSKLYAAAAQAAERGGYRKIISYLRSDENGASFRAAGWVRESEVPGRGWHSASRRRSNGNNAFVAKTRWSRTLRPKPKVPAVPLPARPAALPDWTRIGDADSGLSVGVPFD